MLKFVTSIHRLASATRSKRHLSLGVDRMSTEEKKALFSGEATRLYNMIAENHRQEAGPWPVMVKAVQDVVIVNTGRHNDNNDATLILELATGMGEPAASIAKAVPTVQMVATDISDDMVTAARETSASINNMRAEKADMMDLSNYDVNSFDIVTCCYGFMFPPDQNLALRETHRVLKQCNEDGTNAGTLITTTWNDLPLMRFLRDMMEHVTEEQGSPPPVNPMSLSEPGLFQSMVENAGFTNVVISEHAYTFNFGSDDTLAFKQATMPLLSTLDDMDSGWDKAREYFDAEKLAFGEYDSDGNYVVKNNRYQLLIAKK